MSEFVVQPFTRSKSLILMVLLATITGCAGMGGQGAQVNRFGTSVAEQKIAPPKQNMTHELVKQGMVYLREGDYETAQKVFSASIKVSPNSTTLHLLNGISYHLQFLNNSSDSKELAETAYGLASAMDRTDPLPYIQLGRLHIDSGEYQKASKEFIGAYSISPSSQDALYGLLQASLLQKDFKTALWSGESLKKLNTTDADKLRLMALMYAAVGKTSEAGQYLALYAKANADNPKETEHLKQQVSYISIQLSNLKLLNLDPTLNPASVPLNKSEQGKMVKVVAQATPGVAGGKAVTNSNSSNSSSSNSRSTGSRTGTAAGYESNQSSDSSSDDTSSGGGSSGGSSGSTGMMPGMAPTASSPMSSGGGGGGTFTAVSMNQQQQRWFDCDTRPGLGKAPGGSYGVPVGGTSGDQTLYLEPLPKPCDRKSPPKMASIDAVLIRTIDTQSSSYGINLLNSLSIFAGSQTFSTTGSSGGASVSGVVQNSVIGIGNATTATINSVSGLINYSLNIANSTSSNSQVIARPTLTALDRIPSTFYSGSVITAGLNGGGVSGAQVTNIPTGVSLSVTPTFVDEDSMMLAVKVSRSFVSGTQAQGGFNAGISTEQHAVTSNVKVKYGETLILDGLTLRQTTSGQNGVPVLMDIPIIQYLFNNAQKSLYSENVLVLVTPRRLVTGDDETKRSSSNPDSSNVKLSPKEQSVYSAMKIYKDMVSNLDPNLDQTLNALDTDSAYFRSFKDMALHTAPNSWVSEPGINKFFNDAANLMYFTR